MSGERTFGALVAHDGVTLVEYHAERTGIRVVEQWNDAGRSASIDEALTRLAALVSHVGARRARVALAIEQFGVVQHLMTLPPAADNVIEPIVKREVQRLFGVADPVVAFSRGATQERREPGRADERTAPRQLFVAAAPRATVDAISALGRGAISVEVATPVPKAMHSLYDAAGGSHEATAVLLCLESGPHLAFFLEGRLELAIDPPIALEGDRPSVDVILDQVERGAVYFRQQFRGASPTRLLLAARADQVAPLTAEIEKRIGAQVKPLFQGVQSPEAVIAMGAVLEARMASPLDLFPHPPTLASRVTSALRGANGIAAAAVAAAVIALLWSGGQMARLASARGDVESLRTTVANAIPAVAPMREVAQRRADVVKQAGFVRATLAERAVISRTLAQISAVAAQGVSFDSVRVSRAAEGWNAAIQGRARGATASQAVYALDAFLRAVRQQPTVSSATLDTFEYPSTVDSTQAGAVVIQFHLSFEMKRDAEIR